MLYIVWCWECKADKASPKSAAYMVMINITITDNEHYTLRNSANIFMLTFEWRAVLCIVRIRNAHKCREGGGGVSHQCHRRTISIAQKNHNLQRPLTIEAEWFSFFTCHNKLNIQQNNDRSIDNQFSACQTSVTRRIHLDSFHWDWVIDLSLWLRDDSALHSQYWLGLLFVQRLFFTCRHNQTYHTKEITESQ